MCASPPSDPERPDRISGEMQALGARLPAHLMSRLDTHGSVLQQGVHLALQQEPAGNSAEEPTVPAADLSPPEGLQAGGWGFTLPPVPHGLRKILGV